MTSYIRPNRRLIPRRRPLFSNLIEEFLSPTGTRNSHTSQPSVFDVIQKLDEENDVALTYMFLHGITSDYVDVSVNATAHVINIVVNESESESNEFLNQVYSQRIQKSFRMTSDYDVEQTTVDLSNGILTLTTPRLSKSPESIKLPINTETKGKKK